MTSTNARLRWNRINGMLKVVNLSLIRLYSWRELENKICGKPNVDLKILKEITNYIGCNEKDNHIQYFWKVLEQFSGEERSLYLRFVWGRSRLPLTAEKYVHSILVKNSCNPDTTLPEAHTWYIYSKN